MMLGWRSVACLVTACTLCHVVLTGDPQVRSFLKSLDALDTRFALPPDRPTHPGVRRSLGSCQPAQSQLAHLQVNLWLVLSLWAVEQLTTSSTTATPPQLFLF